MARTGTSVPRAMWTGSGPGGGTVGRAEGGMLLSRRIRESVSRAYFSGSQAGLTVGGGGALGLP